MPRTMENRAFSRLLMKLGFTIIRRMAVSQIVELAMSSFFRLEGCGYRSWYVLRGDF